MLFLCFSGKEQRKSATYIHAASVKQILCMLIIDKMYMPPHAANRQEGDGGGRPTTGEEETLPKANAIWCRGVAKGREPASVWADVLSQSRHGPQLANTFTTSPEAYVSFCPRGRSEEERRNIFSPPRARQLKGTSFLHSCLHPFSHLLLYSPTSPKIHLAGPGPGPGESQECMEKLCEKGHLLHSWRRS